jgi:hypothetical protein
MVAAAGVLNRARSVLIGSAPGRLHIIKDSKKTFITNHWKFRSNEKLNKVSIMIEQPKILL